MRTRLLRPTAFQAVELPDGSTIQDLQAFTRRQLTYKFVKEQLSRYLLMNHAIKPAISTPMMTIPKKINGISMGENTQNHDISTSFVSLRTNKTMNSKPKNPIPDVVALESAIMFPFQKKTTGAILDVSPEM